jgi:hypothetical protein
VNDEMETMWAETVLTCLQSRGAAEENNERPQYEKTTFEPTFNSRNLSMKIDVNNNSFYSKSFSITNSALRFQHDNNGNSSTSRAGFISYGSL